MPQYILFGNPVAHSLSPQLHALFAAQFNTTIDYQKQLTALNAFEKTVDAFRAQGGLGANITIPFKTQAFSYADELTDRTKLAGAVNTFIFKENKCIGDNTDGVGFIRDLKINIQNKNVLIMGAGGATRGILGDIIQKKPASITLYNRTLIKAQELAEFFKSYFHIKMLSTENNFDLIINATTMNFQKKPLFKFNLSNTYCYDLNYGKRADSFLQWAKLQGAKNISDGLGMLVEQAAESYFQWVAKRPETGNVIKQLRI